MPPNGNLILRQRCLALLCLCLTLICLRPASGAASNVCAKVPDVRVSIVVPASSLSAGPDAQRRLSWIRSEILEILGYSALIEPGSEVPESCNINLSFEQSTPQTDDQLRKPQAFEIEKIGSAIAIRASDSLGWLYGFYQLVSEMGVIFPFPGEVAKPPAIDFEAVVRGRRTIVPSFAYRGFWTFDREVPPTFLIWMARNRFNLIGLPAGSPERLQTLGIHAWTGGHGVIPDLAGSDVVWQGRSLQDLHPEWYDRRKANPTPRGKSFYTNPCLDTPGFVAFLADRIAAEAIDGQFAGIDILQIWPSDQPALNIPPGCTAAHLATSDVQRLAFFYKALQVEVAKRLAGSSRTRPLVLAAIGYNDTTDMPVDVLKAPASLPEPAVLPAFFHYPIFRSYARPLNDPDPRSVNSAYAKLIIQASQKSAATTLQTGLVDYLNVSANIGLPTTGQFTIPPDLKLLSKSGAALFAYMHPMKGDWGPGNLANYLVSRLTFEAETESSGLFERYFDSVFGKSAAAVKSALLKYEDAARYRAELMGLGSSLNLLQRAHVIWPAAKRDAADYLRQQERFVAGGVFEPPQLRFPANFHQLYDMPPLPALIDGLDSSIAELETAKSAASAEARERINELCGWIRYTRTIYATLLTRYRLDEAIAHEEPTAKLAGDYRTLRAWLSANPRWTNTIAPNGGPKFIDSIFVDPPGHGTQR